MPERGVSGGSPLPREVWGDGSPQKEKPAEPEGGFVGVAHGSADPRAAAAIADLVPLVAARAAARGLSVPELRVAYLGHAAPSLPQVMRAFGPGARVTVLPLLLTAAYHSKTDIPRVLARAGAGMRITYGDPLGPHPLLLRALERRLFEEALPEVALENPAEVGVVLAAAGSSDPAANATIARLAAQWQAATGWFAVRPAYASGGQGSPAAAGGQGSPAAAGGQGSPAGPTPAQAVTELRKAGARRVVVASYLLAPGLFADRIRDASLAAGAAAVSPALGAAPEVAEVVLDRSQTAGTWRRSAA
jgi:sirohydrochlorin ferrochelatase